MHRWHLITSICSPYDTASTTWCALSLSPRPPRLAPLTDHSPLSDGDEAPFVREPRELRERILTLKRGDINDQRLARILKLANGPRNRTWTDAEQFRRLGRATTITNLKQDLRTLSPDALFTILAEGCNVIASSILSLFDSDSNHRLPPLSLVAACTVYLGQTTPDWQDFAGREYQHCSAYWLQLPADDHRPSVTRCYLAAAYV